MKAEEAEDFINLGVVVNDKGEVLVIRRAKEEKGSNGFVLTWAFPGGRQKFGEARNQCIKREVLAETGYDVECTKEISMRLHPQFGVFIVYHRCRLVNPKPVAKPQEPHEVAEIRWVKPQELKKLFTTDIDPKVTKELSLN